MQIVKHRPRATVLGWLEGMVLEGWRRWSRRRSYKRLMDLDDHMLNDIGVTRHEVEREAGQPLSVNAALELERKASARRRRAFAASRPWL